MYILYIHLRKLIGWLLNPKAEFTLRKYQFMGAFNPFINNWNKMQGEVIKRYVKTYN